MQLNPRTAIFDALKSYVIDSPLSVSERKEFVSWAIVYLDSNPTIDFETFKNQLMGISSFNDISQPIDAAQEIVVNNGIDIGEAPANVAASNPRLIAESPARGNTEDLTHGTNGDVIGITQSSTQLTNNQLFYDMNDLFYWCTFFDNSLKNVGDQMIAKFKTNTNPDNFFTNQVLNEKVDQSAVFINFLKRFGKQLTKELQTAGGNINNIANLQLDYHPVFGGTYNKFHGLQILINDTESTKIELESYEIIPSGIWTAVVAVTIEDHFGLDKHDALTYQNTHYGFAAWWLLQHTRGYVPFKTKVYIRKTIIGQL